MPDEQQPLEFPQGDVAFGALMDALAPEAAGEGQAAEGAAGGSAVAVPDAPGGVHPGGAGAAAPAAPGAPAGDAAAPGTGAPEAGRAAAEPDGRAVDVPEGGAEGAAGGDPQQPATPGEAAAWTADAASVIPDLGGLSNKIEENLVNGYRSAAYEDSRREYGKYFEALEVHPRMLVGKQVPAIAGEGTETLKDTNDAREWQEAIKELLVQEIEGRAGEWMKDATGFMETIHASVDLFKNNPDLIPGTKGFNRKLADDFAEMAKPYEVRIEGKLHGYSVPVQPLIDTLRKRLPAAPVTAPKKQAAAAPPQRGISSKAPTSGEKEDFSTLFGTIGLPNMRI